MPVVHFHHKNGTVQTVTAQSGLSVMEVAVKNKVAGIEGACGGGLACATCHVYVHPDWWDRVLPGYVSSRAEPQRGADPGPSSPYPAEGPGSRPPHPPPLQGGAGGDVRDDNAISDEENDMMDLAFDLRKNSRLSCQIILRDDLDGLTLALPGSKPGW